MSANDDADSTANYHVTYAYSYKPHYSDTISLQSVRQHGTPMRDMRTVMMNDADDDDADYVVPRVW